MTKLYLIRHGITLWNKQKRYCGRKDIPLSEEGIKQARCLEKKLSSIKFDRIYSSHRKRAVQTAKIIFKGQNITQLKDLQEINFGALEGLRHSQIIKKYPLVYDKWLKDPFKNNLPGSEGLNVFKKRVDRAIKKILSLDKDKTTALVCHGGTISIFISGLLKSKRFWEHIPSAASVTIIEYVKNKPKISVFNDTSHYE